MDLSASLRPRHGGRLFPYVPSSLPYASGGAVADHLPQRVILSVRRRSPAETERHPSRVSLLSNGVAMGRKGGYLSVDLSANWRPRPGGGSSHMYLSYLPMLRGRARWPPTSQRDGVYPVEKPGQQERAPETSVLSLQRSRNRSERRVVVREPFREFAAAGRGRLFPYVPSSLVL